MATHSSVLAWRIPGMVEPGGLPSMGSHRVGHDWSNLAAATAAEDIKQFPGPHGISVFLIFFLSSNGIFHINFWFYNWKTVVIAIAGSPGQYISKISNSINFQQFFHIIKSAEGETPILCLRDAKNWLIGKDPDAEKDWRQVEKGTTEDETVGWHHWHNGHEFE